MAAPRSGPRRTPVRDTRADVFLAAAELFSARGFDGVGVDDIAHVARLNKAMIYYHFDDKLALYREVVRDMLRAVGTPRRRDRRPPRPRRRAHRRLHRRHRPDGRPAPLVPAPHAPRDLGRRPAARSGNPRPHEDRLPRLPRILADGTSDRTLPAHQPGPRLHVDHRPHPAQRRPRARRRAPRPDRSADVRRSPAHRTRHPHAAGRLAPARPGAQVPHDSRHPSHPRAPAGGGCTEPPPSNTLRVSGHVEATETRLAPDAGGRILTFTLAKATACRSADASSRSTSATWSSPCDRARADRAAGRCQPSPRARRRPARRHQ